MGPSEARLKVFGAPFFKKARPCPYGRQPKKKPATGADAPVRAIATGAAGEAGGLPSQSPSGASVSAAASVGRWATSHRDVAAPKGEPSMCAAIKLAQSQVSPPPLGEVSCLWHDGEGTPLARSPAPGKPPSRCATGREKRGKAPVSLASLWLTPTKGKGKVETFLKKSFIKKLYARFARPSFHFFHLTYRKKELQLC